MRLLITIVQDADVQRLLEVLTDNRFSVTRLASTGGFLRQGNTTLLMGVEDERLEKALEIIRETCEKREKTTAPQGSPFGRGGMLPRGTKVVVGGATVFMVDVERFEKI